MYTVFLYLGNGDGVSCDFENSICGLQLVDWSIASKEEDHTTGTTMGHYLSTNGNNGSSITSLWIKGGSPLCLSFWHKNHVTGSVPSVPSSIVNVTVHGSPCRQDQIYTHTIGNKHETNWTEEYIQLPINMNIMKIEIDAYNNDMLLSIDDIEISTKYCPIDFRFYEPDNNTVTIPVGGSGIINCSAQVPTGVQFSISKTGYCQNQRHLNNFQIATINGATLSDGGTYKCELDRNGVKIEKYVYVNITGESQCSFENGLCDWTQDTKTDKLDWIKQSTNTPSKDTGPQFDHTYQNSSGYYMYIEVSGQSSGDNAILVSPSLPVSPYCFSFAYSMYGSFMGTLKVGTKVIRKKMCCPNISILFNVF